MWVALDCNIYTNPKTLELSSVLNLDVDATVGKLTRLWSWAVQSENETGEISHLPAKEIAAIMRWRKKPEELLNALIQYGFIDQTEEGRFIHDWKDLNGKFIASKVKDRKRKFRGNSTED
ncbi:MAG: hypothetical protein RR365_11275 [Bacteroides sp.]